MLLGLLAGTLGTGSQGTTKPSARLNPHPAAHGGPQPGAQPWPSHITSLI